MKSLGESDGGQPVTVAECAATGARVTSPRSLEACRRMGIKPSELLPKAVAEFLDRGVNRKYSLVEKEAAVLRHQRFEQQRQHKLETVRVEREAILHGLGAAPPSTALLVAASTTPGSPTGGATDVMAPGFPPRRAQSARPWKRGLSGEDAAEGSTLLQLEERRLARMKLRQQKEIQSAIDMEAKLARLQQENARRAAEEAKRQEDLQRELRARRVQLATTKHEKELEKKREADREALERKNRRRAEAERERQLAEEAQEKAKQLALEAAQRELERQRKAEEFRAQTEALLQHQEDIVAANRRRMLEKERQVQLKMESVSRRRHQDALERREKVNARIAHATHQNALALARRKQEVADKQTAAAERAREVQRKRLNELKERADKSKHEEQVRQQRLQAAHALRQKNVDSLLAKRVELEAKMEATQREREKTRLLAQVERQVEVAEKEQNVARIQRMEAYARQQLMHRIAVEDARSRAVKERKQALLQARQQVATEAMLRRHRLGEAVEQLRYSNKWDKIEETLYGL